MPREGHLVILYTHKTCHPRFLNEIRSKRFGKYGVLRWEEVPPTIYPTEIDFFSRWFKKKIFWKWYCTEGFHLSYFIDTHRREFFSHIFVWDNCSRIAAWLSSNCFPLVADISIYIYPFIYIYISIYVYEHPW